MNQIDHLSEWVKLCAAIEGQFAKNFHPNHSAVADLAAAVRDSDLDQLNHLSAVMLCMLVGAGNRGNKVEDLNSDWVELDAQYHAHFCRHEICVDRRAKAVPKKNS